MSETIYIKANQKDGRVVATDFTEDRDGDRIDVKGLDLKAFKENPIMLFGHNHHQLPIGTAKKIKIQDKSMTFEPEFSDSHELARNVKALWKEGVLKAVSIGFIPKEREGNVFTKAELLEISVVNVPSNPKALAQAEAKGLDVTFLKEVPGNRRLPIFPVDKEWDADAAIKRLRKWAGGPDKDDIDFDKYKQAFGWRDEDDPEKFSAYKLPFADVDEGELKAVPRGVFTAQAALLGARGGVDIPEADRRKVHSLLGTYYKAMDREQPEFREYTIDKVIELVGKGSLLEEDGYHLISALHRREAEESTKAAQDAEVLNDALHLAMQQINKITNFTLKNTNDVRRKRPQESG